MKFKNRLWLASALWSLMASAQAFVILPASSESPGISASAHPSVQTDAHYFSGLDPASKERALFQKQTRAIWASYEKRIGQPLSDWSKKEIKFSGGGTIFYPFSGPDFLTVARVYPKADRYVLVAQQKALKPSHPLQMDEESRITFEKKLSDAWEKFGRLGYFRTNDLNEDQRETSGQLGVTTILMAFASRLGYDVLAIAPLKFNAEKKEWEPDSVETGAWNSVRLSMKKEGRPVTLDYLSMDLSDDGLRTKKARQVWLQEMTRFPILLKAASHLLQEPYFKIIREAIVQNAPLVVQDETGLDYPSLVRVGPVKLYGNFVKSQILFKSTQQPELAAAYLASTEKNELPFAFSYLKAEELRSIQIVRRPESRVESKP